MVGENVEIYLSQMAKNDSSCPRERERENIFLYIIAGPTSKDLCEFPTHIEGFERQNYPPISEDTPRDWWAVLSRILISIYLYLNNMFPI